MRCGGYVDYDFRHLFDTHSHYDSAADPPGPKWLRRVLGEYYCGYVVEVQLYEGFAWIRRTSPEKFTDADAEKLAVLSDVQWLVLAETAITDRAIVHIRGMTKLGRLGLAGTRVTAAVVKEL